MRILLAAFYKPGVVALNQLLDMGVAPEQMLLLTHDSERNRELVQAAQKRGICYTTAHIKAQSVQNCVREFSPDVMFSLYYREIVPGSVLKALPMGGVNLHPALLPDYRGCFSSPWAIINGERHTGFTYHYMLPEVDAGRIILQRRVRLRRKETAYALYHRLIKAGMKSFPRVFRLVVEDGYLGVPQAGEASYYPRQVPYGGYIDAEWDRARVARFIRAMYFPPFRPAVLAIGGKEYEVKTISEYDRLLKRLRTR